MAWFTMAGKRGGAVVVPVVVVVLAVVLLAVVVLAVVVPVVVVVLAVVLAVVVLAVVVLAVVLLAVVVLVVGVAALVVGVAATVTGTVVAGVVARGGGAVVVGVSASGEWRLPPQPARAVVRTAAVAAETASRGTCRRLTRPLDQAARSSGRNRTQVVTAPSGFVGLAGSVGPARVSRSSRRRTGQRRVGRGERARRRSSSPSTTGWDGVWPSRWGTRRLCPGRNRP